MIIIQATTVRESEIETMDLLGDSHWVQLQCRCPDLSETNRRSPVLQPPNAD